MMAKEMRFQKDSQQGRADENILTWEKNRSQKESKKRMKEIK